MASTTRSQSLAHFKRILREVHLQYTHPKELTGKGLHGINIHANKVWTDALKDAFRKHANESDPAKLTKLYTDGEDMAIYLESQRKHKVEWHLNRSMDVFIGDESAHVPKRYAADQDLRNKNVDQPCTFILLRRIWSRGITQLTGMRKRAFRLKRLQSWLDLRCQRISMNRKEMSHGSRHQSSPTRTRKKHRQPQNLTLIRN